MCKITAENTNKAKNTTNSIKASNNRELTTSMIKQKLLCRTSKGQNDNWRA